MQDAGGQQSTGGNGGGSDSGGYNGFSQEELDQLRAIFGSDGTYDPSTETGNQGGGYGFGSINQ